jgi:hypothetical protein
MFRTETFSFSFSLVNGTGMTGRANRLVDILWDRRAGCMMGGFWALYQFADFARMIDIYT